ncbi:MAG TPA: hypothetical protein VEG44_07885 [Candidatus Acidoferrales bacterium]|nr:hypothetical protein [Candidatus Acidoferrales bacterium]
MNEKREEVLTPEEWKEKMRRKRKKSEKLLPNETDIYEGDKE